MRLRKIQSKEDLDKLYRESSSQSLPDQKKVLSASDKLRRKTHNLPDPTHPPMGWEEGKAYDKVFPWTKLPAIHPVNHGDTVIFNAPELPANKLYLGDNLEVLRGLPSECIDLIYIDPPFFSGRNYNVIWGDTNEVRTFYDVWEGGIESYLVWLNARLWEMRRVLKKTGLIFVHCDWHASHYIKAELDRIFGYENFLNEIIWGYGAGGVAKTHLPRKHDVILSYHKGSEWIFSAESSLLRVPYSKSTLEMHFTNMDKDGRKYRRQVKNGKEYISYADEGKIITDVWSDIGSQEATSPISKEYIGYPTQKPERLLERIITASTNDESVVADFFCGGGTTLAVAQRLKRKYIGCDSSRVAVSVCLDRLIKGGEDRSGVKSNLSKGDQKQLKLAGEKVSNIELLYQGVYPMEKFQGYPEEDFVSFVLSSYGASRNTAEGVTHGYRPPGQQEPVLVGPANPNQAISVVVVKEFFDEVKAKLEPNKLVTAKIIAWRFDRRTTDYIKVLERYISKNILPLKIELITLDSKEFRTHILRRLPEVSDTDLSLRFTKEPAIGGILVKRLKGNEFEFEAVDTFSLNEDGWLVNCQWDFDYQSGHFSADKEYILSRDKDKKDKEDIFVANLKAKHMFSQPGKITIACKVQDNLAGEAILSKEIEV